MADPGFPKGGRQSITKGGANLLFENVLFTISPQKNYMKMKKFWPRGVARPLRPLDRPILTYLQVVHR